MRIADVRAAAVIAARIIRQRVRDRSAIVFAILTPVGLALAFATLIPNDFASFHTTIAVVDEDHGVGAKALLEGPLAAVAAAGVADISEVPTEADASGMLEHETAGAAIVIPAGFSTAISSGTPTELRVLGGRFPVSLEVAHAVVSRFASDVGAVQLMVAATVATGGHADQTTVSQAITAIEQPSPIKLADDAIARRQAGLATFYGAAMAIMFVFFATQYGALAIHSDRQTGTLARLLAAPIAPAAILLGTSIAGFALGLLSMTVLVVATTALTHASWGPPGLVALLVLGAVTAAMGFSTLVATLARTPQQAGGLNAIVAMALAAIGGVFIPLSQMPSSLVTISQVTPHAWFLRGIDTLSDPAATVSDIAIPIVVLVGFGVVLGGIGLVRARRTLVAV